MSKNLLFIKAKSQTSLDQHSTVTYIINVNNYTLPPNMSRTNRLRKKKTEQKYHMVDFPTSSNYIHTMHYVLSEYYQPLSTQKCQK